MATSRISELIPSEKENAQARDMNFLAVKSSQSTTNESLKKNAGVTKQRGLSFRSTSKQNTNIQPTPRKALGDKKNLVIGENKIENDHVKKTFDTENQKSSVSEECQKNVKVEEKPISKIAQTSESDDEIDTITYHNEDIIDTFDDILGPVNERISSIPVSHWNKLLAPVDLFADLDLDWDAPDSMETTRDEILSFFNDLPDDEVW